MSLKPDASHDVLRQLGQPLAAFFRPRSVAVVGASERPNSVGRTLLTNLTSGGFQGSVYAVNAAHSEVLGGKAYPSIGGVPEPPDLAVIATPARTVPGVIRECAAAGVRGAVVISAGFRETGPAGAALEADILETAHKAKMRIVGPNCLGVMCPPSGLNATFAAGMARPGNVALISQSGAICTSILDWSLRENVGFSAFISVGSMLDVGWGDLIDYLGDDPHTRSIVIYMESVGDARAFLSAAREVALNKPIIVMKVGRQEAAAKAAASHTGSLSGSDAVVDAAFRRCGVLRVNHISELFAMSEVLGKQPRPSGPRLTILTNAGGPAVIATDALIAAGAEAAVLAPETVAALNEFLPPHWSHQNPIDILGDAGAERYSRAIDIAAKDPNSDGLLVVLSPQGMTSPVQIAESLTSHAHPAGRPVLASFMGGASVAAAEDVLNRAGIPTFAYPDTAARAFEYMWRYTSNLRSLYETPSYSSDEAGSDAASVTRLVEAALAEGRTLLTEDESKNVLAAYGIPVVETAAARTEEDAVSHAAALGYPVVLKLLSSTITHKSDVGGVRLNLRNEQDVRSAYRAIQAAVRDAFEGVTVQRMIGERGYELILGSSVDPQFGPVILFGAGGEFVEIFQDRALALPPLNTTLARRLMEQTRIFKALHGVRGRKPVDFDALERSLVRFSQLVSEQPRIKEIDVNPLLASSEGVIALDARVILHPGSLADADLPSTAIRPYPAHYSFAWSLPGGGDVAIRPIRPEDEPLMVRFHETLSEQTVYSRYFQIINLSRRIAHERLTRICFIDYDREMALVAEVGEGDTKAIAGVARMTRLRASRDAEVAFVVSDRYQNRGLGTQLAQAIVDVARRERVGALTAEILPGNRAMQSVFRRLGFQLRPSFDVVTARLDLS